MKKKRKVSKKLVLNLTLHEQVCLVQCAYKWLYTLKIHKNYTQNSCDSARFALSLFKIQQKTENEGRMMKNL